MSSVGFPDWQKITQWLGAPEVSTVGLALGAGVHDDGPFDLASWASVVVAVKPTGGGVTVRLRQQIPGGPPSLTTDTTFSVAAGGVLFEAIVLIAGAVSLELTGTVPGTTVDYALYPSNTTTNAVAAGGGSVIVPQVALAAFPPANPIDGQLLSLVIPAANNPATLTPVRWLCQYDAADGVWQVSGPPLADFVDTAETTAIVAYGDLATVGPAIPIPRPGVYDVMLGAQVITGAAATLSGSMTVSGAGVFPVIQDDGFWAFGGTAAAGGNGGSSRRRLTLTAATLTAKYRNSVASNLTWQARSLQVQPVTIT